MTRRLSSNSWAYVSFKELFSLAGVKNSLVTKYFISIIVGMGTCPIFAQYYTQYLTKHRCIKSSLKREISHVTEPYETIYIVILNTWQCI